MALQGLHPGVQVGRVGRVVLWRGMVVGWFLIENGQAATGVMILSMCCERQLVRTPCQDGEAVSSRHRLVPLAAPACVCACYV